jgi:hypothetical protein
MDRLSDSVDALARLLTAAERRAVDEAIVAGYGRLPSDPPDDGVRLLAERSVRQQPR